MANRNITVKSDDNFETLAYPTANPDLQNWLREQRDLVRAFLASEFGRTQTAMLGRKVGRVGATAKASEF